MLSDLYKMSYEILSYRENLRNGFEEEMALVKRINIGI